MTQKKWQTVFCRSSLAFTLLWYQMIRPRINTGAALHEVDFLPSDVYTLLSNLDPDSAMGLDGLHRLLSSCAKNLPKLSLSHCTSFSIDLFKKGKFLWPGNHHLLCPSLKRVPVKSLGTIDMCRSRPCLAKALKGWFLGNFITTSVTIKLSLMNSLAFGRVCLQRTSRFSLMTRSQVH